MITFRQPFANEWPITQGYGEKVTSVFHTGIDYGCPFGTSILASAEGTVMFAAWDKTGYGNAVIVRHNSEKSTLYAHLSDISVKVGQIVRQGELLGHSGSTGNSTGSHLHFEARKTWNQPKTHFDPMDLPLMSVDDSIIEKPSKSGLLDAADLKPGEVKIDCYAGAFGHNSQFNDKWVFRCGTKLKYTGNYIKRGDLEFCECEMKLYVAVNDGDAQILVNT